MLAGLESKCKVEAQTRIEVGWEASLQSVVRHGVLSTDRNVDGGNVFLAKTGCPMNQRIDVTRILQNWSNEDADERGQVVAVLYDQLRQNAANQLRNESNAELQPTSLVNEAYIKLVNISRIDLKGRAHFLGLAGRIMREILVDDARRRRAQKRDQALHTRFTGDYIDSQLPVSDLLELDRLLHSLEELDPVYVKLFEARAFAGMTIQETAEAYEMSPSSVKRKWKVTLAWMRVQMNEQVATQDSTSNTDSNEV